MFNAAKLKFDDIFENRLPEDEVREYLIELYERGETAAEIAGAASAMRDHLIPLPVHYDLKEKLIDNCGTGGDKSNSFNISTTVSILLSACGCYVAKHGNRGITSKSGSADMLEALGLNLNLTLENSAKMVEETGFTFMLAQNHHPAMKYIMPIRKSIPHRTIFNILGPLSNPATVSKQVIGVFDKSYINKMATALDLLDSKRAMILSSNDGMDEISISDVTYATTLFNGKIEDIEINPEDYGIPLANKDDIDLIVSDINMPKMNGLEMCEQIRAINKDIPLVITSAHNDTNFLRKAIEVGVNTYAMKPIDLYQLIENIIKAMEPILLRKKLMELNLSLETKIEQEINKIKSILDAQDNIIIVTHKEEITNVNKKFIDFFGIDNTNEFLAKKNNIFDFFQEEFGFITKEQITKQESWIDYIRNLHEVDRVVKIKNASLEEKIFTINVDYCENKDDYYVFSLTDITKLKEKSNLLEYQASHDKLTGLLNRNRFDELYTKEIKKSKRYRNDLSMILLDIDNFKSINDNYGHQTGDDVLKEVSRLILTNVREADICVRWGGEEFLILLPHTNLDGAIVVAEKIRTTISSQSISKENLNVTSSFGVSQLDDEDDENSLLIKSDKHLYKAKNSGKNKVVAH